MFGRKGAKKPASEGPNPAPGHKASDAAPRPSESLVGVAGVGLPGEFEQYVRLSSVAQVGGFRPPSAPRTSWLGQVLLGADGETWPDYEGRPVWGVCQMRIDELPAAAPTSLVGCEGHRWRFMNAG